MHKIQRLYSIIICIFSDAINNLTQKPSWGFVPNKIYANSLKAIKIKNFSSENGKLILHTKDGLYFAAPEEKNEFLCGKKSLSRAIKFLKAETKKNDILISHAALVHNLILRYVTEFSSYPYSGIRTKNLRSGDTFVDIGAFRGYVSLKAALCVGNTGHVLAIEPIKENLEYIEIHKNLNNLNQIEILHSSVSIEDSDHINFYRHINQQNSQIPDHLSKESQTIPVKNTSVNSLCKKIKGYNTNRAIISITTNGTEFEIFKFLLEKLKGNIDYLEISIPVIYTLKEVKEKLKVFEHDKNITLYENYPWITIEYTNI